MDGPPNIAKLRAHFLRAGQDAAAVVRVAENTIGMCCSSSQVAYSLDGEGRRSSLDIRGVEALLSDLERGTSQDVSGMKYTWGALNGYFVLSTQRCKPLYRQKARKVPRGRSLHWCEKPISCPERRYHAELDARDGVVVRVLRMR